MFGIGITTYNRIDRLKQTLDRIARHTTNDYCLVVADDGSSDGTAKWCTQHKVPCVTGNNRGISWNKNRSLFALNALGCTEIVLLEDDCYPIEDGWNEQWVLATRKWNHVAFAHAKIRGGILSGAGTPDSPYVNNKSTAQCLSISRETLSKVGFFDTRFEGYGVEHAEWTTRIKRTGTGFQKMEVAPGVIGKANLFISGGLQAEDAPSHKDKASVERNNAIFREIKEEPVFRQPYRNASEKALFTSEMFNLCHSNGWLFDSGSERIFVDLGRHLAVTENFKRSWQDPSKARQALELGVA